MRRNLWHRKKETASGQSSRNARNVSNQSNLKIRRSEKPRLNLVGAFFLEREKYAKLAAMSIYENFQPLDFERIKTYELHSRPSKVTIESFARAIEKTDSLKEFLEKLPAILAVESLREIARQGFFNYELRIARAEL
jgi:hypothetical protein